MPLKPIIITDMDDTLTNYHYIPNPVPKDAFKITINMKMLHVLHRARLLRSKGKVEAIGLLTNNSNYVVEFTDKSKNKFLNLVNQKVVDAYNKTYLNNQIQDWNEIFDVVYTAEEAFHRTHELVPNLGFTGKPKALVPGPVVQGLRFRPIKNSNTVKQMLTNVKRNTSNLRNRIYFFDDEPVPHFINNEINNYIKITPPFNPAAEDETDYSPINSVLDSLEKSNAGARKTCRRTSRSRRRN